MLVAIHKFKRRIQFIMHKKTIFLRFYLNLNLISFSQAVDGYGKELNVNGSILPLHRIRSYFWSLCAGVK